MIRSHNYYKIQIQRKRRSGTLLVEAVDLGGKPLFVLACDPKTEISNFEITNIGAGNEYEIGFFRNVIAELRKNLRDWIASGSDRDDTSNVDSKSAPPPLVEPKSLKLVKSSWIERDVLMIEAWQNRTNVFTISIDERTELVDIGFSPGDVSRAFDLDSFDELIEQMIQDVRQWAKNSKEPS